MIKQFFNRIEFVYYTILPLLGCIAVFELGSTTFGVNWLPFTGWVVLVYYQMVALGLYLSRNKTAEMALSIVPPFLIGLNHAVMNGTVWHFFLEETMIEVVTLMIGLCVLLLFFKNDVGKSVWDEKMTIIATFVFVGLSLIGTLGIVTTWWHEQFYTKQVQIWSILSFVLAFLIQLRANLLVFDKISKKKLRPMRVFS